MKRDIIFICADKEKVFGFGLSVSIVLCTC